LKANNNDQWLCYGVTKDPIKNDLLLVRHQYNSNLPENLSGVTLKYKIDGLIDKLHNTLNTLNESTINRNDFDKTSKLINKIGKKYYLVENLFKMNIILNKEVLCEGCKGKEIRKLVDKCGNREIAKFLYECRLNRERYYDDYIQWIPFDEFKNIEYLAKGGFGEVHKATWIGHEHYQDQEVVLEEIHN